MENISVELLGLRIFVSVIGMVGNVFLMISILHAGCSHLKSFEVFLLGLAVSNVGDILVMDVYDIFVFKMPLGFRRGMCQTLKFLAALGQTASILFTVLICIFRYQKLRDAERRVNLPIFLDGVRAAWATSGLCVALAVLLSTPSYLMNLNNHLNETAAAGGAFSCPPDFFECHRRDCPFANRLYKYLFIVAANLLPLAVVTATSCLIIRVLLGQRRSGDVAPATEEEGRRGAGRSELPMDKSKRARLQRSTVAVLAAMVVFQLDWTLYLIFHLAVSPYDFPSWSEISFFISTSYTAISPYVYGIGNNVFSFESCKRICCCKS